MISLNKKIFVRFPCVLLCDRRKKEFAVCSCHHHCPRFPYHATSNATETPLHCNIPRFSWISFALTNNCFVGRSLQLSSAFSIRRHFRFNCTCLVYLYFLLLSSVHQSPISWREAREATEAACTVLLGRRSLRICNVKGRFHALPEVAFGNIIVKEIVVVVVVALEIKGFRIIRICRSRGKW